MAGTKIPLTFRIFKGDQFLREETLTQPVIKVGKLSSSHLRLDDDSVSRMHAVIEVSGSGDISIIDLGSTKGTVINGQKVNKAKLQDGDLIVLGDIRIEMVVGQPGAATAASEDEGPTRVGSEPAAMAAASMAPQASAATAPAGAPPPPPAAMGGFPAPGSSKAGMGYSASSVAPTPSSTMRPAVPPTGAFGGG